MLELESDVTLEEIFFGRDSNDEANESEGKEITSGSGSRTRSRELYGGGDVLYSDSGTECLIGISFLGGREGRLGSIACFMRGIAFLIRNLADDGTSISELSLLIMGE